MLRLRCDLVSDVERFGHGRRYKLPQLPDDGYWGISGPTHEVNFTTIGKGAIPSSIRAL